MNHSDLNIFTATPWEDKNLAMKSFALNSEHVSSLNSSLLSQQIKIITEVHDHFFISARLTKNALHQVPLLQAHGFYMIECTVSPFIQFKRNKPLASFKKNPSSFLPKRFNSNDISFSTVTHLNKPSDHIYAIARESFTTDRFHMDFQCPENAANMRFENWTKDLLNNNAIDFDLLEVNGELAGFMARERNHLILAGFSRKYQRSGLGDYLWLSACMAVETLGHQHADTLISLNNLPVLNLYSRLGFKFRDTQYSFHKWH